MELRRVGKAGKPGMGRQGKVSAVVFSETCWLTSARLFRPLYSPLCRAVWARVATWTNCTLRWWGRHPSGCICCESARALVWLSVCVFVCLTDWQLQTSCISAQMFACALLECGAKWICQARGAGYRGRCMCRFRNTDADTDADKYRYGCRVLTQRQWQHKEARCCRFSDRFECQTGHI